MADHKVCPHMNGCALFPMFIKQASLKVWQLHYCERDFDSCERYKLSLAGKAVPVTLLPDGSVLPQLLQKK